MSRDEIDQALIKKQDQLISLYEEQLRNYELLVATLEAKLAVLENRNIGEIH